MQAYRSYQLVVTWLKKIIPAGFNRVSIYRLLPAAGCLALVWFLIRVIPKPSRAAYPCQRAAFPLASGFVIWLAGLVTSAIAAKRAKQHFFQARTFIAAVLLSTALAAGFIALHTMPEPVIRADLPVPANMPIGQAKGVNPGRVTWVHDPDATNWQGMGTGYWWQSSNTDQSRVNSMVADAVKWLAGESTETEAWDNIIRHFNLNRYGVDRPYTPGEKIAIKVNLVGCINTPGAGGCDPNTYELTTGIDDKDWTNYHNTSPQMMVAVLHQLVDVVGAAQEDIYIGDPLSRFPNQYYDICTAHYPDVVYYDGEGGIPGHPRHRVQYSGIPFYWSHKPGGNTDYIPQCYADATYFINIANLKTHEFWAGITACGKNHYGSLIRKPTTGGYYNMHNNLPGAIAGMGHYRPMVDFAAHDHVGRKTLVYVIDALYGGRFTSVDSLYYPLRWNMPPFNNDWTSSVLLSQDPVAIDSVAFDFLLHEYGTIPAGPSRSGAEDYLHEAALADNPPSGTFYDPNHPGDVQRSNSLGTHEHWNNYIDKQYSRNIDPLNGQGIELVSSQPTPPLPPPTDLAIMTSGPPPVNVLNWIDQASGDQQEDGYSVQRKPYGGIHTWHTIADLPADTTTYTDTNQLFGQVQYTYRVGVYIQP